MKNSRSLSPTWSSRTGGAPFRGAGASGEGAAGFDSEECMMRMSQTAPALPYGSTAEGREMSGCSDEEEGQARPSEALRLREEQAHEGTPKHRLAMRGAPPDQRCSANALRGRPPERARDDGRLVRGRVPYVCGSARTKAPDPQLHQRRIRPLSGTAPVGRHEPWQPPTLSQRQPRRAPGGPLCRAPHDTAGKRRIDLPAGVLIALCWRPPCLPGLERPSSLHRASQQPQGEAQHQRRGGHAQPAQDRPAPTR